MKGKLFVTIILMAVVVLLLVVAVRAQDGEPAAAMPEQELLEWDGTALTSRTVPVASEEERALLDKWNAMNASQAELHEQYRSGHLEERDTIETEHGIVTVSKSVDESHDEPPTPEPISVEVEEIETPYGTITIKTQSFGNMVDAARETTAPSEGEIDPLALSEYTDTLYSSCGSNGVEFNFGSNNTLSNYELHWTGHSFADHVVCSASSCAFEITTSWPAFYTYGRAYTTSPGYVYGFGFDDYRCH